MGQLLKEVENGFKYKKSLKIKKYLNIKKKALKIGFKY